MDPEIDPSNPFAGYRTPVDRENFGQTAPRPMQIHEDSHSWDEYARDAVLAPFRGGANALIDAYQLVETGVDHVGLHWLPKIEKFQSETGAGQMASDLFQFGAGFAAGGNILKGIGVASKLAEAGALGRIGYGAAKGALGTALFYSPEANFSNLLKGWGANNVLTDALAIGPDDSEIIKRLKTAVEGAGIGAFADVTSGALRHFIRGARARSAAQLAAAEGVEGVAGHEAEFAKHIRKGMEDAAEIKEQLKSGLIPKSSPIHPDQIKSAGRLAGLPETIAAPSAELGAVPKTSLEHVEAAVSQAKLFNFAPGTGESLTIDAVKGHVQKAVNEAIAGGVDAKAMLRDDWKFVTDNLGMGPEQSATFMERLDNLVPADMKQMEELVGRLRTYKLIMNNMQTDLKTTLEPIKDFTKLSPVQLATYASKHESVANYIRSIKGLGSYYGKGLQTFRGDFGLEPIIPKAAKLGEETTTMFGGIPLGDINISWTPEKAIEYLNSKGGADKVARLLTFHRENILRDGVAALKNTEIYTKGRVWDIAAEYYINGLLSHGQTHLVNFMGNMFATFYRPLETIAGGVLRSSVNPSGGLLAIKDGVRNITELGASFLDTLGLFGGRFGGDTIRQALKDSYISGKSTLLKGMGSEKYTLFGPAITADNFSNIANDFGSLPGFLASKTDAAIAKRMWLEAGAKGTPPFEPSTRTGKTIDYLGNKIRTPTRLLTAMDEFFKQINFRSRARTLLWQEAENLKIAPDQKADFVAEHMDRIIRDGQAFTTDTVKREYAQYLNDHLPPELRNEPAAIDSTTKQFFEENENIAGALKISEQAIGRAREVTFTQESGKLIGLLNAAKRLPVVGGPLRLIMPFVTTPINLIKFAADRTLGPALGSAEVIGNTLSGRSGTLAKAFNSLRVARGIPSKPIQDGVTRFARDLASKDPIVAADAVGRWAFGLGTVVMGVHWAQAANDPNATFVMTGRGPKEHNANRQWSAENQRYSFGIGPAGPDRKWYSFERNDPLSLVLAPIADMVNYSYYTPTHEQDILDRFTGAILTGIANIADKTWLSGVQNTMDVINSNDPHKIASVLRNFGASFLIPGAVASPAWTTEAGDTLREVRKFSDALYNRTPWGRDKLMPQRNSLGEEVKRGKQLGEGYGKWVAFFSPTRTMTSSNDPIMKEFIHLNHGFSPTEDKVDYSGVSVDLRQFTNDKGQTLDDRYAELVGTTRLGKKTLRESLTNLINNERYQKLPEFQGNDSLDNPKVQMIGSFFSAYRGAAKWQLYKESKELQDFVKYQLQVTRQGYQGAR